MIEGFSLSVSSIICSLTFIISFFNPIYFPQYNILKYFSLVIIGLFIIKNASLILLKKFLPINFFLVCFSFLVIISAYLNLYRETVRNPFLAAIVFSGTLLEMFFVMEIMSELGMTLKMLDIYFKLSVILALITEFIALFLPSFANNNRDIYLIGTKFQVAYIHYLIIAFYIIRNIINRSLKFNKVFIVLCIWAFIINIYTQCATGIVGVMLLVTLGFAFNSERNILLHSYTFLIIAILSFIFVFIADWVLKNPLVEYIVVDLLHRDVTLTSRTIIYSRAMDLLPGNLLWGFGYGSAYELGSELGGFSNTQNAILNWIWQCGIPTTIIMIVFITLIFHYSIKNSEVNRAIIMPVFCLAYVFVILGAIEVTFDSIFFGVLSVLILIANTEDNIVNITVDEKII